MSIVACPGSYRLEYDRLAHNYCQLGATNEILSEYFGVTSCAIDDWIATIPAFAEAVQGGRSLPGGRVAERLYRRAMGYEQTVERPVQSGDQVGTIAEKVCYRPDPRACAYWLRNRRPQNWGGRVRPARHDVHEEQAPSERGAKGSTAGRPTSYQPEYCQIANNYCRLGATKQTLAEFFGVTSRTVGNWLSRIPEFADAVQRGRNWADALVADRLYQVSVGYEHTIEHTVRRDGQEIRIPEKVCYPPHSQACTFWLSNRCPEKWSGRVGSAHERTEESGSDRLTQGMTQGMELVANGNAPDAGSIAA